MQRRPFSDVIQEIALAWPQILKPDGSINATKIARDLQKRGFGVKQPTITRLLGNKDRTPSPDTVDALVATYGGAPDFWRGEAPNRPVKLGNAEIPMVCIVLAERILRLGYDARVQLDQLIELHEKISGKSDGPDSPKDSTGPAPVATLNSLKARRTFRKRR